MVLSDGAILVEGPSDELIVQRGYKDAKGRLPIEDGIDVICVGLSHKRFLDLAIKLQRRVWVVIDNDGKSEAEINERFSDYLDHDCVSLHFNRDPKLYTLEPSSAGANEVNTLNNVLGAEYASKEELIKAMTADKTGTALAIFDSTIQIVMPEYIKDVFR